MELGGAVEVDGDGGGPLLAVAGEAERAQELVVLGEVAEVEVDVERGEGVAEVDAEDAGGDERGLGRVGLKPLDVDDFRLAVVVAENLAADGDVGVDAPALRPTGPRPRSASTWTVSAMSVAGPPHSTVTGPVMEVSKPRSP